MSTPFKRDEIPQTQSRLKWALKIKAGPDISDILGLSPTVVNSLAAFSQLLQSNLQDVGTVESFDITQTRGLKERFAFGQAPLTAFQITPLAITTTLKLNRVLLKNLPQVEKVFNFLPQNLLHQQMPFIIYARDPGNPRDPSTAIEHFFLGCWFADINTTYSVTNKDDSRLIQNATVKVGRVLTLDPSIAGNPVAQGLRDVFGGVLAFGENQALLDDLQIT